MAPLPTNETLAAAAALRQGGLMAALPQEACMRLAQAGRPVQLAAGGMLCQAGDPGEAVFVILDGEIEVRAVSTSGREVRLTALGPGGVVGEMAVLDGGPRSAEMVARRRTRLWRIPRAALMQTLAAEPELALRLLAELSRRLRATNAELEARSNLDLGGRLARLLVGEQNARGLVALNQSEMARRVGASREKVNRKLRQWAEQGWVEVTPAGVRVLAGQHLEDRPSPNG